MIPQILDEWTIESLINLLEKGCYETDYFDFKRKLPNSSDIKGKQRLRKTCCAFANSDGGFLIFGVDDDREKPARQRLLGIDSTLDFPEHFGAYPQECIPGVDWEPKNPPLILPNGNYIQIIHIPKSWSAPHCTEIDGAFYFKKRTNKGNEDMTYDEIRLMFLGYYEKLIKLQLLRSELKGVIDTSNDMLVPDERVETAYSIYSYNVQTIETILLDIFVILKDEPELLRALNDLRSITQRINNVISIFFTKISLPLDNMQNITKTHNQFLKNNCPIVVASAQKALAILDKQFPKN